MFVNELLFFMSTPSSQFANLYFIKTLIRLWLHLARYLPDQNSDLYCVAILEARFFFPPVTHVNIICLFTFKT
jgi:hypothetical protein